MKQKEAPDSRAVVIAALAAGKSVADAARAGGVHRTTVTRWRTDPEFRAEVVDLRAGVLDAVTGNLIDAAVDAVATLRGLLTAESEGVQVRAAVAILNALVNVRESIDLEPRLQALEEADLLRGSAPCGPKPVA